MRLLARKRKTSYPSDLTDAQWALLEPLLPPRAARGRTPEHEMRELLNAILYLEKTGCQWRFLPKEFPPYPTVNWWFNKWKREGVWRAVHDQLVAASRKQAGRGEPPTAGILDSQSAKTAQKGALSSAATTRKKVKGRKRHIVTDTQGHILAVAVHAASVQDRDGARPLLEELKRRWPAVRHLWADGGYAGELVEWAAEHGGWTLEIVRRREGTKGFCVLPRRWVVERTFGWFCPYRRLSKDYEESPTSSEAHILIAMIHRMTRRLAPT